MKQIEAKIRDYLAENLSILEKGLILIGKEHYLPPNPLITKSYIDILAQDENNNHVIIEIKRANQTSRQALHEIYKYTESIKSKYPVTKGEVRSIIVSTEWKELFTPFSAYVRDTDNTTVGYKIVVDKDYKVITSKKIIPKLENLERLFSPIHECNLYYNFDNLQKGIKSHQEIYKEKNFKDYVLIILKLPDSKIEIIKKSFENFSQSFNTRHINHPPVLKYMIYSAFQRQSKEVYEKILQKDPTQYKETIDSISFDNLDEDDILSELENSILGNLEPWFYSDENQIGYPAKLSSKILAKEKWEILNLIRSNSLSKNILLTDDKIISELKGNTGVSNEVFQDSCDLSHRAKFKEIKENVQKALKYNLIWKNDVLTFLNKIEQAKKGSISVDIYFPNNILLTLIKMATEDDYMSYLPSYEISFSTDSQEISYVGSYHWDNSIPNFDFIINKYYQGIPHFILNPLIWGGHESRNDEIMEDLGLTYESYLIEAKENLHKYYHYSRYKFKDVKSIEIGTIDLINNARDFLINLVGTYKKHYKEITIEENNS